MRVSIAIEGIHFTLNVRRGTLLCKCGKSAFQRLWAHGTGNMESICP